VALTIDDGPCEALTPQILDVLQAHEVKVTFFCIGSRASKHRALMQRMVQEGHEIANHTWTDCAAVSMSLRDLEWSIVETERVLDEFRGPKPAVRFFRPGHGWYNTPLLRLLQQLDLRCALGNVYPLDPQLPFTLWIYWYIRFRELLSQLSGSIIILHDGAAYRASTPRALAKLLPVLQSKGYEIVTLSTLLQRSSRRHQ